MPGIAEQAMMPPQMPQEQMQQGMQQEMPPQEMQQQEPGGEDLPPELEEQVHRMVIAAASILYNKKALAGTDKMLTSQPDQASAIASVVVHLFTILDEKSGKSLPIEMIPQAAVQVVELVSEYALKRELIQVDEAMMNRAGQQAMDELNDLFDFGFDEAGAQELMQSVDPAQAQQMMAQQDAYARGGNG